MSNKGDGNGLHKDKRTSSPSTNESKLGKRSYDDSFSITIPTGEKIRKMNGDVMPPIQINVRLLSDQDLYRHNSTIGIQQPKQIASFSYDESRKLFHDDRSRKYYHPPPSHANLNKGFDSRIERDESINEHLDSLLDSLMHNDDKNEECGNARKQADLITWRGMMTKLCTVLYENQNGFEMNLMMIDGTLYIEEHQGEARLAEKESFSKDERRKLFGYYGYSFESWCCHSWRDWRSDLNPWDGDVNTNVQWCSIVKTKLGDLRFIMGGEVDAVDPQTFVPIEVKTSMQIRNARDEERFEMKMLRFYMQSFLLGIEKVIVGFRDHKGYLVTHQPLDTLAMPRSVRGKPHAWDPKACLKGAWDILTEIRAQISAKMPKHDRLPEVEEAEKSGSFPVFRLMYSPSRLQDGKKELTFTQLSPEQILNEVKQGKEEGRVGFLTSRYYQFIKTNQ